MEKQKDYQPSKGVRVLTQNKTVISIMAVALYIAVTALVYLLCKQNLENTSYAMQIMSGVLVVGGLVVSVLQYTAANVDNSILRNQERKIRAAEMANQFQAEIIPLCNVLVGAFGKSNLHKELLPKIEKVKLEMFNKDEVLTIVTEKEREECYHKLYRGYLLGNYKEENIVKEKDGKAIQLKFSEKEKAEAENAINDSVLKLANKLEYFSICFNSGIADEDTVYQSLHSTFFVSVHMLYIFIFYSNISESDRFFSNISSLYLRWRKRYDELVKKENEEILKMKKSVTNKIVVTAKK